MSDNIFREKSLKKISSPDDLNEYVRVANPSVWVILVSVIILLLGFIAWGYFGRIDSVVDSFTKVDNNGAYTYISEDKIGDLNEDSFIMIGDDRYEIIEVSDYPVQIENNIDATHLHLANLNAGDWAYEIKINANLNNDIYETKIVTERVKPISLLFD